MNERGLVEVPENAVRDEPIAFGLTAVQLGICAVAVVVAAAFNLLPIWEPIRLLLVLIGAGPIALAAALPVRGEPAYRWIVRAIHHRRSSRCWNATLVGSDKSQLSELDDTAGTEVHPLMTEPPVPETVEERTAPPELPAALPAGPRLHVVGSRRDAAMDPESPAVVPHLVGGLQIACLLSFAGGVGKTTLAVEMASLIGSRAWYQTLDGERKPVRVLLIDAARSNPACHLRLGVDPATVSRLLSRFDWPDAMTFAGRVVETRFGVSLLSLPQLPLQGLGPEVPFGPIEVDAILEAAESAGFQVVVVDLGMQLEEGHRHLIGQSKTVLGVVTPRVEALPDVLRITSYVRALGAGRKLALVANEASAEGQLPTLADEEQVPIAATIPRCEAFDTAGDRGIPAWTDDPEIELAILPLAASVWPLIRGIPRSSEHRFRRGVLGAVRRLLHAEGEGR